VTGDWILKRWCFNTWYLCKWY